MKKTKNLILSALVACAVVLAMLLAIPANAMMALNANLNVAEVPEGHHLRAIYHGGTVHYGEKIDLTKVQIDVLDSDDKVDQNYAYINAWNVSYYVGEEDVKDQSCNNYMTDGNNTITVSYGKEFSTTMTVNYDSNQTELGEVPEQAPDINYIYLDGAVVVGQKIDITKLGIVGDNLENCEQMFIYNGQEINIDTFTIPAGYLGHSMRLTVICSNNYGSAQYTLRTKAVYPVWELTYNGEINVGEGIDSGKIISKVFDGNGVEIKDGYSRPREDYLYASYFLDAGYNDYIEFMPQEGEGEYTVFNEPGTFTIYVKLLMWEADPAMETTMTVKVVDPDAEQPELEPEQPEVDEPVVDQPVEDQPTEEVKPADKDNNGLNLGAILGIAFASLAVLGVGGSMLWIFVFRK